MKATRTPLMLTILLVSPLMSMTALGAPEHTTSPSLSQPQTALASLLPSALPSGATVISKPKVLDFYAAWCEPCRKLKPIIEKAKSRYKGKVEFVTVDVNNPASSELMKQYNIGTIPTLMFLDNKSNLVSLNIGYSDSELIYLGVKQLLKQSKQQK